MHLSNTCRLLIMMALVVIYFVIEITCGYIVNSLALIADSFHMLSDFVSLCVGVAATRISKWPRSNKNTFGWQRAEILGSLANAVVLVTLCFTIFINAIERFIIREPIKDPQMMVFVGIGGLAINIVGLIVLGTNQSSGKSDEHESIDSTSTNETCSTLSKNEKQNEEFPKEQCFGFTKQRELDEYKRSETCKLSPNSKKSKYNGNFETSLNMRAVFLHVLADFFGSIIVCVSALLLWKVPGDPLLPENSWKLYVDPTMSLIMVVIIVSSAVPLIIKSSLILLQSVPKSVCVQTLLNELKNVDGVHGVYDLNVWRLKGNTIVGTVHILCNKLQKTTEYVKLIQDVEQIFKDGGIFHTTIELELDDNSILPANDCFVSCVADPGVKSNARPPLSVVSTESDMSTESEQTNFALDENVGLRPLLKTSKHLVLDID